MSILVLGLGNILLSDEGVGVRAVEAFQAQWTVPDGVDVVDGGTCGMDMLDIIASHRTLIVVDAVKTGAPVGTVVKITGSDVPVFFRGRLSPHQLGLSDLLATLTLTDEAPGYVSVIGCVPASMETSLEMTPGIAARIPAMVDLLVEELRSLGVSLEPKAP
ncbi:hydrogenase maturation protease [Azospirillum fermentarium]|uniref:HyaD/HybD family hydrogenase maturation endopeptidase n=1 Tax=Azospirillum fermentarium TaxID=1233114 RepID=UPI0022267BEB|nr:HyaD/HybD family hydrogenase maturation endopeptidase [Azospirillum fermentarium]MCW2246701.1 hydrogenase maturation protease [Azospirillum fermentarium]